MLTGELPLGRFAPPSQKVGIDVRLDEVVLRSLETEPKRRYQNVRDVKTDLESISHTPQPAQPAAQTRERDAAEIELLAVYQRVRLPAVLLLITGIVT